MNIRFLVGAIVCPFFLLATVGNVAGATHPKPLEIGQPAPDFKLPGIDGKTYTLADFAKARILAIVFTCNHCPTAQAYDDRLMQLQRDYQDRGVTRAGAVHIIDCSGWGDFLSA